MLKKIKHGHTELTTTQLNTIYQNCNHQLGNNERTSKQPIIKPLVPNYLLTADYNSTQTPKFSNTHLYTHKPHIQQNTQSTIRTHPQVSSTRYTQFESPPPPRINQPNNSPNSTNKSCLTHIRNRAHTQIDVDRQSPTPSHTIH